MNNKTDKLFKIEIKDLGRNKVNLEVEVDNLEYTTLYSIVKPHLASDLIDFIIEDTKDWGIIRVGYMRAVGKIKITEIGIGE